MTPHQVDTWVASLLREPDPKTPRLAASDAYKAFKRGAQVDLPRWRDIRDTSVGAAWVAAVTLTLGEA